MRFHLHPCSPPSGRAARESGAVDREQGMEKFLNKYNAAFLMRGIDRRIAIRG